MPQMQLFTMLIAEFQRLAQVPTNHAKYYKGEVLPYIQPYVEEKFGSDKSMTLADWARFGDEHNDEDPKGTMVYFCIAVDKKRGPACVYVGKSLEPKVRRKAHVIQAKRDYYPDKRFCKVVQADRKRPVEVYFVPFWVPHA